MNNGDRILTINGGSSSIKFSFYRIDAPLKQLFNGRIEYTGKTKARIHFSNTITGQKGTLDVNIIKFDQAVRLLIEWFERQEGFGSVTAVGHRIVHGMQHTKPKLITDDLLWELRRISAIDPEHLPREIELIEMLKKRYPHARQVACFDTSFHGSMPLNAKLLAIPRRYYTAGIKRYGFHGLSYAYLMEELQRLTGEKTVKGKIILAHLGSGASLAAVKNGKSIDTSMGFTPTAGLPMSTRTGDMDPGVAGYLQAHENLSPEEFRHLINHQSGLLGLSETSGDMRELTKTQSTDKRAMEAIDFFCYQTKKWIGSFSAALSGLDTLVFSGGIGENSPEVRRKICKGLEFLGIDLDEINNRDNAPVISTDQSDVTVRVIKTNEELMIAKLVVRVVYHNCMQIVGS